MFSYKKSLFFVSLSLNCYFVIMFEQFIHQLQGISFLECKRMCDQEAYCLSVQYQRRFSLCKLYDVLLSKDVRVPGTQVHLKTQQNSNIVCGETGHDQECQKRICPVPTINGADMSGNLFDIGSKVKFTCRETGRSQTIQCLSDCSWSANTLFCTSNVYSACGYPGTLQHGQLGTLTAFNDSHGILNVSCDVDYTLYFQENILCEIATGNWTGLEATCCLKLKISNWTKIYSSRRHLSKGIVKLFRGDESLSYINTCTTGFYRNDNVFVNWENGGITSINFTIIANDTVVAYMLFNAAGTTAESWFGIENLVESSWSDLQPSTEVQEFSFLGKGTGHRRWFTAKYSNDTCTGDIGWFVATWSYFYSCSDIFMEGKQFLYARNGHASRFDTEEAGVADKFEIWIQN